MNKKVFALYYIDTQLRYGQWVEKERGFSGNIEVKYDGACIDSLDILVALMRRGMFVGKTEPLYVDDIYPDGTLWEVGLITDEGYRPAVKLEAVK